MNRKEFKEGLRDGLPICVGYLSVSFAYGMRAVLAGLPVWLVGLISLSNLTSAGQFAGTNLILAGGAYAEIALTTLVINLRYFLMSLSVSQRLDPEYKMKDRLLTAYGVTDEIFAVSMNRRQALSPSYMAGLILTPVIGWTSGTVIGGIATTLLPARVNDALGIALYAMFIAIIVPKARESRPVLFTVILAILLSVLFYYVPVLQFLSGGWGIIVITLAVAALAAVLFPVPEEGGAE